MKSSKGYNQIALLAGLLLASVAGAQTGPLSGITVSGAAIASPTNLGGAVESGVAGAAILGVSRVVGLEGGYTWLAGSNTTGGSPRTVQFSEPSVGLRLNLGGVDNGFGVLFGGGAMMYKLGAAGALPSETRTLPFGMVGFSGRQHLSGKMYFDISARGLMTGARAYEFSATPGNRSFSVVPELRIGLSFLAKPGEPQPRPVDAPVQYEPSPESRGHGPWVDLSAVESSKVLGTVSFEQGSTIVGKQYRDLLKSVALYLSRHPQATLHLWGATEGENNSEDAVLTAQARGTAIKDILVRIYGADTERIDITSIGTDYDASKPELARRVDMIVEE